MSFTSKFLSKLILFRLSFLEKDADFLNCQSREEMREKQITILGKNGHLTKVLRLFRYLSPEDKIVIGEEVNKFKSSIETKYRVNLEKFPT